MSAVAGDVSALLAPEEDATTAWLREQWERLGCEAELARVLLAEGVDYHEVESVMESGAALDQALRCVR